MPSLEALLQNSTSTIPTTPSSFYWNLSDELFVGGHGFQWDPVVGLGPTDGPQMQFELPSEIMRQADAEPSTTSEQPANTQRGQSPSGTNPLSMPLTVPRNITETSNQLVEHYFRRIAVLFCCYDGNLNPFRATVARLWNAEGSASIFYTIQSMAAAQLRTTIPQFAGLARRYRRLAMACLDQDVVTKGFDTKSLLALILLGTSVSWHEPEESYFALYERYRSAVEGMRTSSDTLTILPSPNRNLQFCNEVLVYWDLFLSFMTTAGRQFKMPSLMPPLGETLEIVGSIYPHPWTGIAGDAVLIVLHVARLVRRNRERIIHRSFVRDGDITAMRADIQLASELEERLLSLTVPPEDTIVNPGDTHTPVKHFVQMATCFRHTGLLQIYRCFPDILARRLRDPAMLLPEVAQGRAPLDGRGVTDAEKDAWLTDLAIHTLDTLGSIPITSGTTLFQPLMLVAAASELRLPPMPPTNTNFSTTDPLGSADNSGLGFFEDEGYADYSIPIKAIKIAQAREFVRTRLPASQQNIPNTRVQKLLELVGLVWRRMDAEVPVIEMQGEGPTERGKRGHKVVYWVDVMIETGWELS